MPEKDIESGDIIQTAEKTKCWRVNTFVKSVCSDFRKVFKPSKLDYSQINAAPFQNCNPIEWLLERTSTTRDYENILNHILFHSDICKYAWNNPLLIALSKLHSIIEEEWRSKIELEMINPIPRIYRIKGYEDFSITKEEIVSLKEIIYPKLEFFTKI